jgi:signal transduction histidine kinase/ActR/RegA family two-component response regulator
MNSPFEQQMREVNEALLISSVHQHELTERAQKVERELEKALAFADDIIATLREPFLVLDGDLRVRTANRSFYDSFHVSKETTENCCVYELGNGQWDIPGLRKLLNEVLSHNQSVHNFEVEHSFPALGLKTMLLNARPFPPDSKHPELILLAVEDVTAERMRASELAEANRRKDEFLAMLSHELRNPLAPIASAVQILGLQKNEDRPQQQARMIIERQVGRLTRLIDDLLEVSRITTGRIHLQQKRLEVNGIVENAVESVRSQLDQYRHDLTLSLSPDPIWLYADAARLEQVVVNLLTNAIKYTDKSGHIWLTVQREGDECVLRVRDTGVGIDPDLLPHIFDLFTQAERSLDRSQGGLGIGLALVQRIVEMHQGRVEAQSTLGQGSEFVVRLPLMTATGVQPPSNQAEVVLPLRSSLRILVTDDNVDAAEALKLLLIALGHEVLTAHDGSSALKAAVDFHPNVVLLDIGLPGMDGFEVAKKLRQQVIFKNVVLVAMTGYGQDSNRQRTKEPVFDHYMIKPLDFNKLQGILASVSEKAI